MIGSSRCRTLRISSSRFLLLTISLDNLLAFASRRSLIFYELWFFRASAGSAFVELETSFVCCDAAVFSAGLFSASRIALFCLSLRQGHLILVYESDFPIREIKVELTDYEESITCNVALMRFLLHNRELNSPALRLSLIHI